MNAIVSDSTLAVAAQLLGKGFDAAAHRGMEDAAVRRVVVSRCLSLPDADTQPAAFIDAAFKSLAESETARATAPAGGSPGAAIGEGGRVRVPFMLMDARGPAFTETQRAVMPANQTANGVEHMAQTATDQAVTDATIDVARRELRADFQFIDCKGKTDREVQHAVVRRKLGEAACEGKPAAFLDAAFHTLATVFTGSVRTQDAPPAGGATVPMLDRGKARAACDQAMQDLARTPTRAGTTAYEEMCARMSNGWKDPTKPW